MLVGFAAAISSTTVITTITLDAAATIGVGAIPPTTTQPVPLGGPYRTNAPLYVFGLGDA